ncbi:MAG: hypothetical protein R2839_09970 [Thermomicrobiales bacterium]
MQRIVLPGGPDLLQWKLLRRNVRKRRVLRDRGYSLRERVLQCGDSLLRIDLLRECGSVLGVWESLL